MTMKKNIPKGLGFLEVIIALSVMIVGVTSGITLTTYNLANVVVAENQVLATGLAREPIELIRAQRDSNWLAGKSWNDEVDLEVTNGVFQYFDENDNSWKLNWLRQEESIDNCARCEIIYNDTKKMYMQNINEAGDPLENTTLTGYRRLTKLKNICWDADSEKQYIQDDLKSCDGGATIGWRIKTEVSWYDNQNKKYLTVTEDLYDWR